ncbi:MAG: hypothetical protein AB1450_03245 [Pseudomonadota bacterium]
MQNTSPNPGSIVSRERVRLMLMMRRMVREEFGVTVQLGDDDATEELLAFADRARNTLLRQMGRELEALAATAAAPEVAAVEPASLCYRGVPLAETTPAAETKPAAPVRRIYRGQVIG